MSTAEIGFVKRVKGYQEASIYNRGLGLIYPIGVNTIIGFGDSWNTGTS